MYVCVRMYVYASLSRTNLPVEILQPEKSKTYFQNVENTLIIQTTPKILTRPRLLKMQNAEEKFQSFWIPKFQHLIP